MRIALKNFNLEREMSDITKTVEDIRLKFEDDNRLITRNAAERFKERVLVRLADRKVFGTPEMRKVEIKSKKEKEGWSTRVMVDDRVRSLDSGTRPHYIPRDVRTRAYAERYGLTFKQFRGGIARRGTKAKPIFDYARVLAERQMYRDIRHAIDNL